MKGLLGKLINRNDPTRDIKLLAFGSSVVASIVWLSVHDITDQWVSAYLIFMASVSLGGAAWSAIEKLQGGKVEGSVKGTSDESDGKS